jgi:hypothetical protein
MAQAAVRAAIGNAEIADALERIADLLDTQAGQTWRVRAYRNAARGVRAHPEPLARLDAGEGIAGLERLEGIGRSIASLIHEYLHTGRVGLLERLEGQISPEDLFTTLPGVGEGLARRLHAELGAETLEELELAAHDGRLDALPGFGPRRVRQLRDALEAVLSRSSRRRARRLARRDLPRAERPAVATILAVDGDYRDQAGAGLLRTIAPRRFNPERKAWLPVLHTERDGWGFQALFSNTARAHELGTVRDWVVIYWERDGDEDQCTVVTERHGPLAGRRVVRGREAECARFYAGGGGGAELPPHAGASE